MQGISLFALAVGLSAGLAAADVNFDFTHSSYEVRGLTPAAIDADIERRAPRHGDGIVDGKTEHAFDWQLRFAKAGADCRVASDEVTLKVDILLPVWADAARASPHVQTAWTRYFEQLKAHEERHKDISLAAAQKLDRLVHRRVAPGSCASLEASLDRAAEQVLAEENRVQEQIEAGEVPFHLQ